jgi:hypothetical protein
VSLAFEGLCQETLRRKSSYTIEIIASNLKLKKRRKKEIDVLVLMGISLPKKLKARG